MSKSFKIGTRGSLLALTQCGQVKNELEKLTGHKFELVVLKTQGDLITKAPLWQLEGKDFFTKELDEALLLNQTDLTVHSYKDLGSERPEGIKLASVTKRRFGHDILLFRKDLDFKSLDKLIVGTSSPRRIENLEKSLPTLLPFNKPVETKFLRGNVNTRIEKLLAGDYHAIALALPGLERLAQGLDDEGILALTKGSSRDQLKVLIKDLSFMLLPVSILPPAASQGALGIEINANRNDNGELEAILKKIHDESTVNVVSKERAGFNNYGGGCHLAVGVHARKIPQGIIEIHKGKDQKENIIAKTIFTPDQGVRGLNDILPELKKSFFFGMSEDHPVAKTLKAKLPNIFFDKLTEKKPLPVKGNFECDSLFVTSPYTIKDVNKFKTKFIFTAGTKTWEQLAANGTLVNGCADYVGEEEIKEFFNSYLYQMFTGEECKTLVLTHEDGHSSLGQIIPSYSRDLKELSEKEMKEFADKLAQTKVFYWGSPAQFEDYMELFPHVFFGDNEKIHLVGPGKTFKKFDSMGIPCIVVPTLNELKESI